MKRKYFILLVAAVLSSCERNSDTDDSLLKFYGDAFEDIGYSISKTDNGYFITGQITEPIWDNSSGTKVFVDSEKKIGVIKTNSDGNVLGDIKILGGDLSGSGTKVITLDDGTAIATGYVIDSVTKKKDIYVVKLNADGNTILEKIFKSESNQYGTDIIKTPEGFLVLGNTDVLREPVSSATGNADGKKDILLLRLNENLESVATIPAVGFIGNDEGVAIKADINGGYMVVGTTDRSDRPSSEQSGNNIFLLRINSDGSTTQPRIVGGTKNETASDFEVLSDGYLIAGTIGTEGVDQQGYIWKIPFDIYDVPEFEHNIDIETSPQVKVPYSIKAMCRYKSNSFLLAGQYNTGLSAQMLIFSIDASGNLVTGRKKITGGTGTQTANDVICDADGNIVVVGSNSYENNSMISFLKFRF
jgi:hypothetical protein